MGWGSRQPWFSLCFEQLVVQPAMHRAVEAKPVVYWGTLGRKVGVAELPSEGAIHGVVTVPMSRRHMLCMQ